MTFQTWQKKWDGRVNDNNNEINVVRMWLVLLDKIIKNYMNWFFCYSNTSYYKTDVVKFVIFVTLFNKECDIYSEKINKKNMR